MLSVGWNILPRVRSHKNEESSSKRFRAATPREMPNSKLQHHGEKEK
jgi:hypothetical protein